MKTKRLLLFVSLILGSANGQTILHYRVSGTDAATVATGTIPGVDGSANGTVFAGTITLSEDIPTEGVPAGSGDRSLVFDGASGINLPGTRQLLNSTVEASGGFTYEAWFSYAGGGNINSIIDYAGTEKLVREAAGAGSAYRNNSAAPLYPLGPADPVSPPQWHYAAVVFEPTGSVDANGALTGNFTFYYDGNEATETIEGVTISNFGDSLNRTIAVGAHPLGFGGDFYNGLIYEPRVSLGALDPSELLFGGGPGPAGDIEITGLIRDTLSNQIIWTSQAGQTYRVEFSQNLEDWTAAGTASAVSESTSFTHPFLPNFVDLVDSTSLYYRVVLVN